MANRSGVTYVLGRVTGQFFSGKSFTKTNWYADFDDKGPRDGKLTWETNLGPSVAAGPITYLVGGKQYVSIQCGNALYTFGLR